MNQAVEFDLEDLNIVKDAETPFEFEYIKPDGSNSGIFLSVLGGHSDRVRSTAAELINARRQKQAAREVQKARSGRNTPSVEFDTVESDIEFGQRLAAVRLVGWRGIKTPWDEKAAAHLCKINPLIADQVMQASDDVANFTKV